MLRFIQDSDKQVTITSQGLSVPHEMVIRVQEQDEGVSVYIEDAFGNSITETWALYKETWPEE